MIFLATLLFGICSWYFLGLVQGTLAKSRGDLENITRIKHEKGSDLFGRDTLNGDGGYPEQVIGTVKRNPKNEESYTLSFTVYNGNNGGKRKGTFRIDPKLQPHR